MTAPLEGGALATPSHDTLPEVMEPVERYRNQTIRCMYALRGYGMKLGRCSVSLTDLRGPFVGNLLAHSILSIHK